MSKRSKPYVPKTFESTGCSGDTSANIYMSMLMSNAWNNLSKNARVLYLYCKAQYYAEKRKPTTQTSNLQVQQSDRTYFTMNKSKWCELYGLYKEGNARNFTKDMKELIDNGFVELVENGRLTRTKSVYKLSDKWQDKR